MYTTELRPLGAGELLDRAVTLFVRRFLPIVVVLAVVIAPLMLLEAMIAPGSARVYTDLGRIVTAGGNGSASRAAIAALSRDSTTASQTVVIMLLTFAVRLLMWSAIVAYVAAAYAGTTLSLAAVYRTAVRCWPAQLVVALAFLVMSTIASIPLFMAYLVGVVAVVALVSLKIEAMAVVLGIAVALIVFGGFALVGSWIYMSYQLATVAVVTEGANPIAAVTASLRRTFTRQTWWRTVVAGLIVLAVAEGGALPMIALAGILSALTHAGALFYAIAGAGTILLDGLVASFVVIYATDVRVRREGLDLLAMTQPTPA